MTTTMTRTSKTSSVAGAPDPGPAAGSAIDRALLDGIEDNLVVDTSEREPVYLLLGRNGAHIRLSASAVQLLRQVGHGASFERLADALSQRDGKRIAPADVEASYRKVMAQIAKIEAQGDRLHGAFWFRRGILPGRFVARVAGACAAAFHPVSLVVLVAAAVAFAATTDVSVLVQRWGLTVETAAFWPAFGLFLGSLVAHEIGHASACARYGAKPSEIGLALYFIYPVFYSNVTAAWTLKRWQRVVVDVGGVYFQLVVGAVYAAAYVQWGWEPLRVAVLFILGSCVFSLNPILKFDGYWVIADALGVTNLQRQPARILRHAWARLRGRPTQPLPWRPFATVMLAGYSALTIGFWVWFLCKVAPALVPQAVHSLRVVATLVSDLVASPAWPGGEKVQEGVAALYVFLLVALMAWQLVRALIRILPTGAVLDHLAHLAGRSGRA
jgi:putative peptide zinc metalloprotease protein